MDTIPNGQNLECALTFIWLLRCCCEINQLIFFIVMDRLMQPTRLDLNASSPSASREWRHWFKTFENYIEVLDASLAEERRTDRLEALVNSISHQVFEYIEDSATYDAAIAKLQNLYTKAPNEVFARHLLATAKQQSGQTLDEFLLSLQKLARDCNFRAVSGDQYEKEDDS